MATPLYWLSVITITKIISIKFLNFLNFRQAVNRWKILNPRATKEERELYSKQFLLNVDFEKLLKRDTKLNKWGIYLILSMIPILLLSFNTYILIDKNGVYKNNFFDIKGNLYSWDQIHESKLESYLIFDEEDNEYIFKPKLTFKTKHDEILLWDTVGWESPSKEELLKTVNFLKLNSNFISTKLTKKEIEVIDNYKIKEDVIEIFQYANMLP